jgi:hypothetical protein
MIEVSKGFDYAQRLHLGKGRVIRFSARNDRPVHSEPNSITTGLQEQVVRLQSSVQHVIFDS